MIGVRNIHSWIMYTFFPQFLRTFFPYEMTRPMIQFIKDNNPRNNLVGVEIGTHAGYNANNILHNLPIEMLYLVDPYIPYVQDNLKRDHSDLKEIAHRRLKPFKNHICFIEKMSECASNDIPDNVDFIYMDGNHQYNVVKKDIKLYYSKVKNGGVLGGHDFCGDCLGVVLAVTEFAKFHNLKIYSSSHDWWIKK